MITITNSLTGNFQAQFEAFVTALNISGIFVPNIGIQDSLIVRLAYKRVDIVSIA